MALCQILYVSDNKEKADKEDKGKDDNYSALELGEKLKHIGFDVGEVRENVGFDETLKLVHKKIFTVSEVFSVL
jgi:hypothetical protein